MWVFAQTVQATALVGQLHHQGNLRANLVVAPESVLDNWERELNLWLPDAWVVKYHGSQNAREAIRDDFKSRVDKDRLVMITTYTLFQSTSSESKRERKWINKQDWEYVILDEGHSIKNANSKR